MTTPGTTSRTSPGRINGRVSNWAWPTRPSEADPAIPTRSSARPVTTTGSRVSGTSVDGSAGTCWAGVWAHSGVGAPQPGTRHKLTLITVCLARARTPLRLVVSLACCDIAPSLDQKTHVSCLVGTQRVCPSYGSVPCGGRTRRAYAVGTIAPANTLFHRERGKSSSHHTARDRLRTLMAQQDRMNRRGLGGARARSGAM